MNITLNENEKKIVKDSKGKLGISKLDLIVFCFSFYK